MSEPFDLAVCSGRLQPLDHAELALVTQALALAPQCLVIVESAHAARSPRHPFTWQERAELIRQALPDSDRPRVQFAPLRDLYDDQRWASAVRSVVTRAMNRAASDPAQAPMKVALVGDLHDDRSTGLLELPGWTRLPSTSLPVLDPGELRAMLFSSHAEQALKAVEPYVPAATSAFLQAWCQTPHYEALRTQWRAIVEERAKWAGAPYPPVFVTVDVVLHAAGHVLLIRRGAEPGKGRLALPGGFLEQHETVYQSALRELHEETTLGLSATDARTALRSVQVFDHPMRSQRGRVITHAHYFVLDFATLPEVRGADDAAEASWVPIAELCALESEFHDDHFHILDRFLHLTDSHAPEPAPH